MMNAASITAKDARGGEAVVAQIARVAAPRWRRTRGMLAPTTEPPNKMRPEHAISGRGCKRALRQS